MSVPDCIADDTRAAIRAATVTVFPEAGLTAIDAMVDRVLAEMGMQNIELVPGEVADAAQRALLEAPTKYIPPQLRTGDQARWNAWRHER